MRQGRCHRQRVLARAAEAVWRPAPALAVVLVLGLVAVVPRLVPRLETGTVPRGLRVSVAQPATHTTARTVLASMLRGGEAMTRRRARRRV